MSFSEFGLAFPKAEGKVTQLLNLLSYNLVEFIVIVWCDSSQPNEVKSEIEKFRPALPFAITSIPHQLARPRISAVLPGGIVPENDAGLPQRKSPRAT